MLKVKTILLIFWLFFTLPAPFSFSQTSGMRHNPGMGMRHWREEVPCWRASELNLSPDQRKGLFQIQQIYFREIQLLRTELLSKRLELREFLINPVIRSETIRSKYLETIELEKKLEEKAIEYLIKVRNLLTQEQLKSWAPEKEFPLFRRMTHGLGPMGPMFP
jgi:Spy/CpxP family protein refolding chaperone